MIRISPFTPLFFAPSADAVLPSCRYVQTFSNTDQILVEIVAAKTDAVPAVEITDEVTGLSDAVELSTWQMNETTVLYFHIIQGLSDGYYTVCINGMRSEMFMVTSDAALLKDTALIQYSSRDNKSRDDVVFVIDNMQHFFDFRVPGGFKDLEWHFEVDSEQFTTSDSDIVQLYAKDSTQKTFTMGGNYGCPVWFAQFLNRLLCCEFVYVDGKRYCRKESSVPETTSLIEGYNGFVFKQLLQETQYLDAEIEEANKILLRRVDAVQYRNVDDYNQREIL